jgi:LmbE family N-acetylglucosaminyl deacetylase
MDWEEIQRVAVIFAHPDDAEFGSAGTSAKLVAEGKQVFYVVVTDGSKGSSDPDISTQELVATRQKEQCDAADVIGVSDVAFLGFEDGMLEPTIPVKRAVVAAIRRFKPDVVICPSPERNLELNVRVQHPDHLAVGEAALAAVYPLARDRMTFPDLLGEGLEPHAVAEVWVTGTTSPDFFVDITEHLDTKIRALKAHVSQVGTREVETWMPERARQLASGRDMEYAEAFKRIQIG